MAAVLHAGHPTVVGRLGNHVWRVTACNFRFCRNAKCPEANYSMMCLQEHLYLVLDALLKCMRIIVNGPRYSKF